MFWIRRMKPVAGAGFRYTYTWLPEIFQSWVSWGHSTGRIPLCHDAEDY